MIEFFYTGGIPGKLVEEHEVELLNPPEFVVKKDIQIVHMNALPQETHIFIPDGYIIDGLYRVARVIYVEEEFQIMHVKSYGEKDLCRRMGWKV